MQIHTGDRRSFDDCSGKNLTVGHHDDDVGVQIAKSFESVLVITKSKGLKNGNASLFSENFDFRRRYDLLSADLFVWLRVDAHQFSIWRVLQEEAKRW